MRIAFFGLPLAALLLLHDGHEIALAAISRPGAPGFRRLRRRIGDDRVLRIGRVSEAELVARVREAAPDLVVSWFWTKRLPMELVALARHGGLGVHPSLLPRHRGADHYFAAIDAGDEVTGVTAHRIAAEYDTGAVLAQRELAIDPAWNAWQLARALDRPSLALLRDVVARFARGERPRETAQDEARATRADAPDDDACALVWTWTTARLLRRIRALAPVPGAVTEIGERGGAIHAARPATRFPAVLAPGEATVVEGEAVVRTADGALTLLSGEVDDVPADGAALARVVTDARSAGQRC
jgi:methionyl-tRNA formyltransferase